MRVRRLRLATVLVIVGTTALTAGPAFSEDPPANGTPVLGTLAVSPTSVGVEGGAVDLSITATDPDGEVTAVVATAYSMHGDTVGATMGPVADGDVWSGVLNIPENLSGSDESWSVEITAVDDLEGSTTELRGSVEQGSPPVFDELPDVDDVSLTPQALPVEGGPVAIAASATDDHAISEVSAVVADDDGGEWVVALDGVSASGYAGSWDAPVNDETEPHVYTVTVSALDDIGQQRLVNAGQVTVAGVVPPDVDVDLPPTIVSAVVSPTALPAEGGVVDVAVRAGDDVGIATVRVAVSGPGIASRTVTLPRTTGKRYAVSVQLPSNGGRGDATYDFTATVTDNNGASTTAPLDPVVVAADDRAPLTVSQSTVRAVAARPGQRVALSVVLRNTSTTSRVVGRIAGLDPPFRLQDGARRFVLGPGERLKVGVVFLAARPGRSVDRLVIVRRDGRQPRLGVRLVGLAE